MIKCILVQLSTLVTHDERMNPIDIPVWSKVNVIMGKFGNDFVNTIENKFGTYTHFANDEWVNPIDFCSR